MVGDRKKGVAAPEPGRVGWFRREDVLVHREGATEMPEDLANRKGDERSGRKSLANATGWSEIGAGMTRKDGHRTLKIQRNKGGSRGWEI